jgi:replicative superfamily II helicase
VKGHKQSGFPLFERARQAGILESGNALIVAPTATGKSYIGRLILRSAVKHGERGVHVYLVPYRALASEMYDSFQQECESDKLGATVKIATGDHTDPIYPQETDILIATYERFAALMRMPDMHVGRVVVDEIHLIADETRGSVVEGLLARLKSHKRPTSLCALSAVISNPEELGEWLGVQVVLGESTDRTVEVEFCCEVTPDPDGQLTAELKGVLGKKEQAIIFCRSKPVSQRVARDLRPMVEQYLTAKNKRSLRELALAMAEDDEDAKDLLELLSGGIAFHHAGLSRDSRKAVETAFRERHLKAIACTPTLAAGVNLPARLVVVRDVFRTEFVRGFPTQVILSTGELLNMLGRAGRPGQVESGRGVALIDKGSMHKDDLAELQVAIREGKGNPVRSRLPDSFDSLMRFLLAVAADRGECTMADLAGAVRQTLWYHEQPADISFERPFSVDIMEDIPSFERVTPDMRVERAWAVADGVAGSIVSGPNKYNFSLRFSGEECTCPARAKWRRQDVCKHLACAIHHLLFASGVDREIRSRAIYAAAHRFRKTLDLGTKIGEAVDILLSWGLLEHVPGGFCATAVGTLAANSGMDLLLIRTANDRIREYDGVPTTPEVAAWAIKDYFGEESKREKWLRAAEAWLGEVDVKKIKLPEKYRGVFERGLEELGQLTILYGQIAAGLGKPEVTDVCRLARGCLQYGVTSELIPLAALRIPQLGRARCRFLYAEKGIRSLEDLARAEPSQITGPTAPLTLTRQWVETAQRMLSARRQILSKPEEERKQEVDDFLSKFRVDQLTLFDKDGIVDEAT